LFAFSLEIISFGSNLFQFLFYPSEFFFVFIKIGFQSNFFLEDIHFFSFEDRYFIARFTSLRFFGKEKNHIPDGYDEDKEEDNDECFHRDMKI